MKVIFTLLLIPYILLFPGSSLNAGADDLNTWKLRKEKEGIKIYIRDIPGSNLKELKIMMSFKQVDLYKIVAKLNDANSYTDWMFKCSESKLVESVDQNENISYYKFDFPWPLNDRDVYMKSVIQDYPDSKRLVITTTALSNYANEVDGIVRIDKHFNQWEFYKKSADQIDLTYYLKTNPGGSIPDWMVNLAVDKGPLNSLSNFRAILKK